MEQWKVIPGFDRYSVSDLGRIRNDDTSRIMVISRNQQGVCHVGMMKGTTQRKRSVARLVAEAYLDSSLRGRDNATPIHLNGDQSDNRAENLAWRPNWFAVKHAAQFNEPPLETAPMISLQTGRRYSSAREVAIAHGLIEREVVIAALDRTYTFPTYEEFRFLAE